MSALVTPGKREGGCGEGAFRAEAGGRQATRVLGACQPGPNHRQRDARRYTLRGPSQGTDLHELGV